MGRDEKATSIAELREKLGDARGAVLTDFRGLSVAELTELRTLLRKSAVEYKVVKNTLAKLAVKDTGLADLAPYLEGPTGIAISAADPVAASKAVSAWARGREKFSVKGGGVDRRLVGPRDVAELADLPPREALLGRMAGVLQAPLAGLAQVLSASLRGLANALDQVRQKKEGAA